MTPEGKVKARIKKVLDNYKGRIYTYMPVPGGFGKPTLDYIGFFHGRGFAIEAKKPRGEPTERQDGTIADMRAAGARVFVIDGLNGELEQLDLWLDAVEDGEG